MKSEIIFLSIMYMNAYEIQPSYINLIGEYIDAVDVLFCDIVIRYSTYKSVWNKIYFNT